MPRINITGKGGAAGGGSPPPTSSAASRIMGKMPWSGIAQQQGGFPSAGAPGGFALSALESMASAVSEAFNPDKIKKDTLARLRTIARNMQIKKKSGFQILRNIAAEIAEDMADDLEDSFEGEGGDPMAAAVKRIGAIQNLERIKRKSGYAHAGEPFSETPQRLSQLGARMPGILRHMGIDTAEGVSPLGPVSREIARKESEKEQQAQRLSETEHRTMSSIVDLDNQRFQDELRKKKELATIEKRYMSAIVKADASSIKEQERLRKAIENAERRKLRERFNLEVQGERRLYLEEQDQIRNEDRRRREIGRRRREREHQEEQRRAPFIRSMTGLGLSGARAFLGQGTGENILGGIGGGVGGIIGGAIGGLPGAAFGEGIGNILGSMFLNPLALIEGAMKPALDYRLSAYRLGIASRAGGAGVVPMFYQGAGSPGLRTAPPWMQMLGLEPQEALNSVSNLGVVPSGGRILPLAKTIAEAGWMRGFANMAPDTVQKLLGQGATLGFTNLNSANSTNRFLSGFEGTLADANTRGLDRSRLLQSMEGSLELLAQGGAQNANLDQIRALYARGIDTGMLGGRTGVLQAGALQSLAGLAENPFSSPAVIVRAMQAIKGAGNLGTAADVQGFFGRGAFSPNQAAQLAKTGFGPKIMEVVRYWSTHPTEAMKALSPTGSKNEFEEAFLGQILGIMPYAQGRAFFTGRTTAPQGNVNLDYNQLPERELKLRANAAAGRLYASDFNLEKLATAADNAAEALDRITQALMGGSYGKLPTAQEMHSYVYNPSLSLIKRGVNLLGETTSPNILQ